MGRFTLLLAPVIAVCCSALQLSAVSSTRGTALRRAQPRVSVPRLCTAANDNDNAAADTAEQLKKAVESAEMESISTTSDNAAAELERLQAGFAKRLEAMGAAENVPPPPPPKERGAFTISNASANSKAAEEALFRMRRKDNGLLEADNKEAIERAQRAAKSWMDAGLNERAKAELERVQPFCSFKTEVGAPFHLLLAKVLGLCGQNAQARRTLQHIASEAQASTHRWQAEQALERSSSTGKAPPPSEKSEYSGLFQMPDWNS